MALSPQWLDELRTRTQLSALVGRTTKLQRAGREWRACCPFHDEKTPSFYVNDEKGFYHCFGCGAHGDAIRWLTDQRGMAFMDAVKELAGHAGMDLPAPDPRAARAAEQRATLHDVTAAAQAWFEDMLRSADGAKAREYLKARGIDAAAIKRFGFGYAPDSKSALHRALSRFDDGQLIEAGLRVVVEDKEPYDRFRGRLMLPIHDPRGRVIGFGGRILEKIDNAAKYMNSPDTPLFDKGRTLYNLHRAAPAARKAGRIVVVEGYMDVVALSSAGVEEAVAPMGTALTEHQLELLWRQADKPILCFDGDAAGQRAAMRAIERALPLLRPGHSLQFVTLPAGMDPDDVVRREGRAGIERLLGAPQSLLDWVWEREKAAAPLAAPEDKAALKARLVAHAEAIAHPDIAALYRREWLARFSAFAFPPRPERAPYAPGPRPAAGARWGKLTVGTIDPATAERLRRSAAGGARDGLALAVLHGLARHPPVLAAQTERLLSLAASDPRLAAAIDALLEAAQGLEGAGAAPISLSGLPLPPPGQARYSFLTEGADTGTAGEDLAEALALLVEWPALDAAIAAATARFEHDPEGAFAEQQRLGKRKLEFEGRLGQMARKRAAAAVQDNGRGDEPGQKETG